MTLIVARRSGNTIALVSDTGISHHGQKLDPKQFVPKITIINPDVAVGFAGSAELGIRAVTSVPSSSSYRQVVDFLLAQNIAYNDAVEFLIAFNKPSVKSVKISGGRISNDGHWIGDHAAFSAYQRFYMGRERTTSVPEIESFIVSTSLRADAREGNPTLRMIHAMRYVLIDNAIKNVFGDPLAVNNAEGEFLYRPFTWMLHNQQPSFALLFASTRDLESQKKELQQFAYSCCVIKQPAPIRGVAYHYHHAKLTYLYWGERGQPIVNAELIKGMGFEKFMKSFEQRYDVAWQGQLSVWADEKGEFPFDIEDELPTRLGTIDEAGKLEMFDPGLDAEGKPRLFPSSPSSFGQREK